MSQPTPGDVHVNTPLTNISIACLQTMDKFVADKVFPNIPVTKQSDRYYTYDRSMFFRDEMKSRAPGTESAGVGYSVDNTPTYFADVKAIHHDIPDQRRANSDSVLDPDREAVELITHKAMIKREKTWVAKYFATGIWASAGGEEITGVNSGEDNNTTVRRWNDPSSKPIEDVRRSKTRRLQSTGYEPNTLVLGQQVWDALVDHPEIIDRVKYGQANVGNPAMATMQALKQLFEIERIFVMKSVEATALEGAATQTYGFIGGKHALLCYSAPSPGLMTPSAGYTFSWTGYLGAAAMGQRIKRFRMENLSSDRVEMEMAYDQKLVFGAVGCFMYTIVA